MAILFREVLVYRREVPGDAIGPTDVLVEGSRITTIGQLEAPPDARIIQGHGHHLLIPGLMNAHFHSSANHLKGAFASLPLELFMLYESPAGSARPSPREAYLRTMLAALEMLGTGTTAVQDDAFFLPAPDPEIIDAVLQAYGDCGIRASIALDQPKTTGLIHNVSVSTATCSPAARASPPGMRRSNWCETWHSPMSTVHATPPKTAHPPEECE